MLKLIDLEPSYASDKYGRRYITFLCPKCRDHHISVQIQGPPETDRFIWQASGDNFETMTLQPSVAWKPLKPMEATINSEPCKFHFFVTNGAIQLLQG